jgi:hypothetical protein
MRCYCTVCWRRRWIHSLLYLLRTVLSLVLLGCATCRVMIGRWIRYRVLGLSFEFSRSINSLPVGLRPTGTIPVGYRYQVGTVTVLYYCTDYCRLIRFCFGAVLVPNLHLLPVRTVRGRVRKQGRWATEEGWIRDELTLDSRRSQEAEGLSNHSA